MESGKFVRSAAIAIFFVFFACLFPVHARVRHSRDTNWSKMASTHFLIYYRPSIKRRRIYKIRRRAEGYYRKIVQDLGLIRSKYWVW